MFALYVCLRMEGVHHRWHAPARYTCVYACVRAAYTKLAHVRLRVQCPPVLVQPPPACRICPVPNH